MEYQLTVRSKFGNRYVRQTHTMQTLDQAMVFVPYCLGVIKRMNFARTSSERFVFIGSKGIALIRKV